MVNSVSPFHTRTVNGSTSPHVTRSPTNTARQFLFQFVSRFRRNDAQRSMMKTVVLYLPKFQSPSRKLHVSGQKGKFRKMIMVAKHLNYFCKYIKPYEISLMIWYSQFLITPRVFSILFSFIPMKLHITLTESILRIIAIILILKFMSFNWYLLDTQIRNCKIDKANVDQNFLHLLKKFYNSD